MSVSGDIDASGEGVRASRRRPRSTREQLSRKKACEQCSTAKVRCDLKKPRCSRCESRRINCDYTAPYKPSAVGSCSGNEMPMPLSRPHHTPDFALRDGLLAPSPDNTPGSYDSGFAKSSSTIRLDNKTAPSTQNPHQIDPSNPAGFSLLSERGHTPRQVSPSNNKYWAGESLRFANLNLICPIDAIKIRNRWLGDFIPSFNQRVKNYPPGITVLISRVLKSYTVILLRAGHLPPFIHPAQLSGSEIPTPFANCLSLVRMWDGQVRGSESMVRGIIKTEMMRLFEERAVYGQMDQLAAFQAYLTYAMILFFADGESGQFIDRQVMINLQDLACDIASSGLVCPGELSQERPDWESWIVASTKRRALYTMYLFDNIFCSQNGLPTFLGEELEGLLAPASKPLWEISDRASWGKEYNAHLHDWPSGGLRIDELWPPPETGAVNRRKRVDRWLTSVDEFGMMLFAVTLVTHGG